MSDDSLESLMAEYRRSFPDKAAAIRTAADAAWQAGWTGDALTELASLVHKLAGSAGAYGYADIHQQAAALNRKLKPLLEAASQGIIETEQSLLREDIDTLVGSLIENA